MRVADYYIHFLQSLIRFSSSPFSVRDRVYYSQMKVVIIFTCFITESSISSQITVEHIHKAFLICNEQGLTEITT